MGAQVSYLLTIKPRERISEAVRFSRNPSRDDDNITSSNAQEGVAERRICRTAKHMLVKASTGSRVVSMNEHPVAAPLVGEELKSM